MHSIARDVLAISVQDELNIDLSLCDRKAVLHLRSCIHDPQVYHQTYSPILPTGMFEKALN